VKTVKGASGATRGILPAGTVACRANHEAGPPGVRGRKYDTEGWGGANRPTSRGVKSGNNGSRPRQPPGFLRIFGKRSPFRPEAASPARGLPTLFRVAFLGRMEGIRGIAGVRHFFQLFRVLRNTE
jgi:hypothetical protein